MSSSIINGTKTFTKHKEEKHIAIIVPVYNEQENIIPFYKNIKNVLETELSDYNWHIQFINDGSTDGSWALIAELVETDDRIYGINLSKNFGKEMALTAGIETLEDVDALICIDADLQHPPELIPEFIMRWKAGADIVIGIRKKCADYTIVKSMGSKLFYYILDRCSDIKISPNSTDFRLIDRKVIQNFKKLPERNRMFRGLIDWLGFEKSYIDFCAPARNNGTKSHYSYRQLFQLAVISITSFSLFPLRITGYLGLMVSSATAMLLMYMFFTDLIIQMEDFTPRSYFIVLNTLLSGVMLSAIGMIALYIGNIHTEVAGRPLYIVKEVLKNQKTVEPDHHESESTETNPSIKRFVG